MAKPTGRPIRDEIIELATTQIQIAGVNGVSFGGLAKALGIKAPSIHHHFRTKDDLVVAVARRYRERFAERLDELDAQNGDAQDGVDRIRSFAALFEEQARSERLCLCGAVAADWMAVGSQTRDEVTAFFRDQLSWLNRQLAHACDDGAVRLQDTTATASLILRTLEGALLVDRTGADASSPTSVIDDLLTLAAAA